MSAQTTGSVIDPTFLLRGIDYLQVLNDYYQGKYNDIEIPKTKVTMSSNAVTSDYSVGTDKHSEIYEYVGSSGNRVRMITTNHKNYNEMRNKLVNNSYLNNIREGIPIEYGSNNNICLWCRRIFSFEPVGMPIKMEYLEDSKKNIFHVVGNYCTYECCYSHLLTRTRSQFGLKDYMYMDSESMLRIMYGKTYPDQLLIEQNEWTLAKWNGGPMSEDDFFSGRHRYEKNVSIVLLPSKNEYYLAEKKINV